MNLVFMGAEVPSHRILLTDMGVKHVSINYYRLTKRGLPKTKDYLIQGRFPDDVAVYVDGGGHQINDLNWTEREIQDYAESYQEWVALNADRISGATEFDLTGQTPAWRNWHREQMYEAIGDKLWVVWHPETSYTGFYALCERFINVAITGETIEDDTSLAARSRAMLSQFPDLAVYTDWLVLSQITYDRLPLHTASSLSWLSPMMTRRDLLSGMAHVWCDTRRNRKTKPALATKRS
jgi:hypothetical protein